MNSLQSIAGSLPGYILSFAGMLLAAAQLAVLLKLSGTKRDRIRTLAALLHLFLGIFFLSVFLNYSYDVLLEGHPEMVNGLEWRLLSLPWFLYAVLELVSLSVIFLYIRAFRRSRITTLSPASIRQAVDLLPAGLLFSDPDGTVILTNVMMRKLCRSLTGRPLNDAGIFRQRIRGADTGDHLIHVREKEVWQFTESRITLDGREYDQIIAEDMTEQYRITEELSEKNRHLKEVQARMRSVAAKERSLVAAREVMNARMTVHNRMGAVLLSGKYYLDYPENVKEKELLHLLEYSSRSLLDEAEQSERDADVIREAIVTARRIGVAAEIIGTLPENETARTLIAQAIDQCAANTARHAGGDRLLIRITEKEDRIDAAFSNNGKAPASPVTETGGLAVLRKTVEKAGGTMTVQSEPVFLLTLAIPFRTNQPLSGC